MPNKKVCTPQKSGKNCKKTVPNLNGPLDSAFFYVQSSRFSGALSIGFYAESKPPF
ncbi:MAG: hypothetical protein IJX89_05305 [Alphaproteobacteria bacterium]|nr:hypothetical protein [Alphaproteobacteria bacterium]